MAKAISRPFRSLVLTFLLFCVIECVSARGGAGSCCCVPTPPLAGMCTASLRSGYFRASLESRVTSTTYASTNASTFSYAR